MKKTIILIIFFTINVTFSQTKTEIKEWIVEKYNEYKSNTTVIPRTSFDLYFDNEYLIYIYINDEFKIKIKDIKKIKIKHEKFDIDDNEGWTSIFLYFEKNKSRYNNEVSDDTMIKITVSNEFIKDGYKNRMEKAILFLVKSYGGNATIKNEAF